MAGHQPLVRKIFERRLVCTNTFGKCNHDDVCGGVFPFLRIRQGNTLRGRTRGLADEKSFEAGASGFCYRLTEPVGDDPPVWWVYLADICEQFQVGLGGRHDPTKLTGTDICDVTRELAARLGISHRALRRGSTRPLRLFGFPRLLPSFSEPIDPSHELRVDCHEPLGGLSGDPPLLCIVRDETENAAPTFVRLFRRGERQDERGGIFITRKKTRRQPSQMRFSPSKFPRLGS